MIPPTAMRFAFADGRTVGSSALARVALAVVVIYERDHRVTIRAISDATGYALSTCERAVAALRELGIVDFVDHHAATLHPIVERVA